MQTHYYVLASQDFLIKEEPFEEVLRERTRNYQETKKNIDFCLLLQPAFLEEIKKAAIEAKCPEPSVAVISTNKTFIDWLQLRLDNVIKGEFQAPSETIPELIVSQKGIWSPSLQDLGWTSYFTIPNNWDASAESLVLKANAPSYS